MPDLVPSVPDESWRDLFTEAVVHWALALACLLAVALPATGLYLVGHWIFS